MDINSPSIDALISSTAEKFSGTVIAPQASPVIAASHDTAGTLDKQAPAPEPSKPVEPALSPIAAKIKADREARAARQAEQFDQSDVKTKLAEAEAKLAQTQSNKADVLADAAAWAQAQGLTKEEQLLFAQTLLYDIVPNEADADMRIRLFEAKQARAKRLEQEEAKQAQAKREAETKQATIQAYAEDMEQAVSSFVEGSYPESEAYFGDSHEEYLGAMMAQARHMAEQATKSGQRADLSPQSVAKALEQAVVARLTARDQRKASKAKPVETKPVETKQSPFGAADEQAVETLSATGLTGAGTPRLPAITDKERKQRAIQALLGGK